MSELRETDSSEVYYTVRLQNSTKLDILLKNEGAECLREKFKELFEVVTGLAWGNTAEDGDSFIEKYGDDLGLDKPERQIQCNVILSGNLEEWDVSLLVDVLIFLELKAENPTEVVDIQDLKFLKHERNVIAHIGSVDIPNDKFREKWNRIISILRKFGVPAEKLEEKNVLAVVEQTPNVDTTTRKSLAEDTKKQSSPKLEALGNELFNQGNFEDAIAKYTEGIDLSKTRSQEDLARLYLNRCSGYLSLNKFEAAKCDAQLSVLHHPTSKGYFKLGKAYEGLSKFNKALTNYEKALSHEPENKHNPECYERAKRIILQQLPNKDKQLASTQEAKEKQSASCMALAEELGVRLWHQLATAGAGDELVEIALKIVQDVGLNGDPTEAVRKMEEIAAQEIVLTLNEHRFLNSNKVDAEQRLGFCYTTGAGVTKDIAKGVKYFEAAISHGMAVACHNLGVMYKKGDVVPLDESMAIDLWKLGAYYGSVECIQDLAHHYASQFDHENSWNWFNFAVSEKSTTMEAERCLFEAVLGTKKLPTFDHTCFKANVRNEVLSGKLKRLICSQEVLELHYQEAWLPAVPKGCDARLRKHFILQHREAVSHAWQTFKSGETPSPAAVILPNPMQTDLCSKDTNKISFKPIFLDEMTAAQDHTYDGYELSVTIIEDAVFGCIGVPLVIEDERGNVHRATIFNFAINRDMIQNVLGFGCNITIRNPILRTSMFDDVPMIQVYNPDEQLFFRLRESRCRLCGKRQTNVKCRKCKRCLYCSKQCLQDDCKYLRHALVCIPFPRL